MQQRSSGQVEYRPYTKMKTALTEDASNGPLIYEDGLPESTDNLGAKVNRLESELRQQKERFDAFHR